VGASRDEGFVRSTDNFLWQSTYAGGQWTAWQQVDNQLAIASSPLAISFNPNHIFVFATGANGTLYCKTWISGFWTNWDSLYGNILGKPSGAITVCIALRSRSVQAGASGLR
jgi:hypothetical protein